MSSGYGYPAEFATPAGFAAFCAEEFGARLAGQLYLDHAGATLHATSQLAAAVAVLSGPVMGNPHSQNAASVLSGRAMDEARYPPLWRQRWNGS
jgi:hypothetical protein